MLDTSGTAIVLGIQLTSLVRPQNKGKLYLGSSIFNAIPSLHPGDWVRVKVRDLTVLARVWLHPLPLVDHGQLDCAVVEHTVGKDDCIHPCLSPPVLPGSMEALERVTVGVAERLEVEVVVTKERRSGLTPVVTRLLAGLALTQGCWVQVGQEGRDRYGILGVRVRSTQVQHPVKLGSQTEVVVIKVQNFRRLQLLQEGRSSVKLGGVKVVYSKLRESLERGVHCLVSGAPGVGKTALVETVAKDMSLPVLKVDCSELARSGPGETEAGLRSVWDEAVMLAGEGGIVLLLENVECVGSSSAGGQARRLGAQLQSLLDWRVSGLLVVTTSTHPEVLLTALRRPGRLGTEICLHTPNMEARSEILSCFISGRLEWKEELISRLASATQGFLAADLGLLVTRLASLGDVTELDDRMEMELARTRPSHLRSGLGSVSPEITSWDSIGGMDRVKAKLRRAVELPLTHPGAFLRLGVRPSKGVLLWGPPGCGKTRLVRAVASNCRVTFLAISAAEIFSPYVGDSEKAVVELFRKARMGAPTVLFIDEIDALVAKRDTGQKGNSDRVLATLLTEMDGLGGEKGRVVVVGATNRPETMDCALTRPGRLDTLLEVPLPDLKARKSILSTLLTPVPHQTGLDLDQLAEVTAGFSGADLENLVRETVLAVLTKDINVSFIAQGDIDMVAERLKDEALCGSRTGL